MADLRPISLCNVSMKVITKILANRLQGLLGEMIQFYSSKRKKIKHIIKTIIKNYEAVSGQRVNFHKSEIVFRGNVKDRRRQRIVDFLQVREVSCHNKYLGLPLVVGQRRCEAFKEIVEKVWKKTMERKHKLLSQAGGREVLIKAVLQAMPLYIVRYGFLQGIDSTKRDLDST